MNELIAFLSYVTLKYDYMIFPLILIILVLFARKFRRSYRFYSIIAEKKFVCPNCGLLFHVKWYKLPFNYSGAHNSTIIRCPGCGIKDLCKRTDES